MTTWHLSGKRDAAAGSTITWLRTTGRMGKCGNVASGTSVPRGVKDHRRDYPVNIKPEEVRTMVMRVISHQEYTRELSRILRELLPAGAKRDYDRMLELAKDIEQLVMTSRDGSPDGNSG